MTAGLWDRLRAAQFRAVRRIVVIAVAALVGLFQVFGSLGLRINTSLSLPIGLYITTTDSGADLVEFCPAEPSATLAIVRGYRDRGSCKDGAAPLMKPEIAKSGDVVDLSARGISANGVLLANTAPLSRDTKGRLLEPWPFGYYVVSPGTVWVASSYHPRSFDSRYFGPISTTAIRHRVRALLTF